jgi:hypothetical protein
MKTKAILIIAALAVATALAQAPGKGPGPGFQYDPSTETTISGTIEQINTVDAMCHAGTHVVIKTDKGNVDVGLGPTQFLTDQKLELKKGDTIKVIGAKANTKKGEVFIARQITSGEKTVTLRDTKGVPAWPRGMCR